MVKKAQIIFDSYNQAVEKAYEGLFNNNRGDDILKQNEEQVSSIVDLELKVWENEPVPELDNKTPDEFFKGINSVENIIEVFKLGATTCDRGIPQLLLNRLEMYGEESFDELLELAGDTNLLNDEEGSYISIAAIRTLGKLRAEKVVIPLLELIYSLNEDKENIVEEINDALVDIGNPIIEPVVCKIDGQDRIGYLDEYVLNALVRVAKNNKSDKVFRCLKSAFGKMEDKLLGALCFADYGDGRAIPALRGYTEKNRASIDKATFLEIAAAIKKLGGNIDDLVKGTAF